ncbi:MAG: hypothetical protein AAFY71_06855 [Bacteroidota bacterium]
MFATLLPIRRLSFSIILILPFIFGGCDNGQAARDQELITERSKAFMKQSFNTAVKAMAIEFPFIQEYPNFCHPDTYDIQKIEPLGDEYRVYVKAECRLLSERESILFFKRSKGEKLYLYDTYNFVTEFDSAQLAFARATSCLGENDTTDVAIVNAIKSANKSFGKNRAAVIKEAESKVILGEWDWKKTGKRDGGTVTGFLTNNIDMVISKLKLELEFKDKDNKVITIHKELMYDIPASQRFDFEFKVPFVGDAKKADAKFEWRNDFLKSFASQKYEGGAISCE